MLRRVLSLSLVAIFTLCLAACAEKEVKIHQETQSQTESAPTDTSPGEMIVE